MIKVKNVGSSTVIILCTDLRFRRKLMPGREVALTKEVYDELSFDTGFQTLVQVGSLRVSGAETEDSEVIMSDKTVLSREEIKEIFEKKDYSKFAKEIKDASPATKESVAAVAVEMRVVDNGFVTLINKYCNMDLLSAIANQSEE